MPTQKIDPKVIFASNAPAIDKPPVFSDKTKGWDVSRLNDGRPTIKEMNKVQQDTDLKILWLNENSVTPYDSSIDYPEGAVTLKDGSFKQLASGDWVDFLDDFANKDAVKRGIANRYDPLLTYDSGERVVLTNGDIVKSTVDGNTNDPNVNMTGWVKTNSASQIFDESGKDQQGINDILLREFNVLNYGADPTGATSSHQAFRDCASALQAAGGGKVTIPYGTYIAGKQIRHLVGESEYTWQTPAYEGEDVFFVANSGTIVVEFQGCTIKFEDGMKYGRWDAETEQPINGTDLGFVNHNKKATTGRMFGFQNNEAVLITGTANLDGNLTNYSLGGLWGDLGRQCASYGIWISGNKLQGISGAIKLHHFGLDGLYVAGNRGDGTKWKEGDFGQSGLIVGVESEYNARQGLSHTGGSGTTYISCKFNNIGRGRFASAPSAGADVEAEAGDNRDVLFLNCEFINNVGNAYIDATGDSDRIKLVDCKLVGTTNYAGWFTQSQLVDCTIVGAYGAGAKLIEINSESKKAYFSDCIFTDDPNLSPTGEVFTGIFGKETILTPNAMSVNYDKCEWHTHQNSRLLGFTNPEVESSINIKNGKWVIHKGATIGNVSAISQFYGANLTNFDFIDERPAGEDLDVIIAKRADGVWKNVSFQSATGKFRADIVSSVTNTDKKRFVVNDRSTLKDALSVEGAPNWSLRLIKGNYSDEYTQDTLHLTTSKMVMSSSVNGISTDHQWNPFGISDRVINKTPTDSSWAEAICVTSGYTCPDAWVASTSIALNAYRYANGKVYQAIVAGITGQTSPSHSSGISVDGSVTWLYIGERAIFRFFGIKGSVVVDRTYSLSATPTVQELATALSTVQLELRELKTSIKNAGYIQ